MSATRHPDDFDPAGTPTRFYAVCTTPRSGSTLLSRSLWRTGRMGAPAEYFNLHGPMFKLLKTFMSDNIGQYTDEILRRRTSPNGVFGVKLFFNHWQTFKNCGRFKEFRNLKLIHLRRKDRIAQAVSHRLAMQTDQWTADRDAVAAPHYDFDELAISLNEITFQERCWADLFTHLKVKPLSLVYEELRTDVDRHVAEICRFVGVDASEPAAPVEHQAPTQQSSTINVEWSERFKADLARWRERQAMLRGGPT